MLFLLWISIIAVSSLYFFRESFIAELAISFVPYIIWFCILALSIEIYLIIHESKRRRKHKWIKIFLTILVTILTIWIWTLYSSEFFWFYNQNDESIRLTSKNWIKIFYANILYKNTDYESLKQKVVEENPDIVILVEFSDEHEDEMKDFFKENYPYMNRNSRSTMLAWDVVFSKLPIEDAYTTWIEWRWNRKYSYIQIECKDFELECENNFDLYVIHTAAPVSVENFEMRNKQLEQLWSDFRHKDNSNPTIVIWDFNLSPRSYYYKELTKNWNLKNALSYQNPNYTRSLLQQWIFRSHIDQLFISPKIQVSKVKIENLTWSDHRSFSFKLGITN
jgi:endonuclease/exonuclease/phosphatase (EEP) superfamily protein YafD